MGPKGDTVLALIERKVNSGIQVTAVFDKLRGDVHAMREVKRNVLWALRGKAYHLSLDDQKNLYAEGSI